MASYLGISEERLIEIGALHTAREISQQPAVWKNVGILLEENKKPLHQFLQESIRESDRIIMTGAGSSAFIGLSLRGIWQRTSEKITDALATTDLVSHPHDLFRKEETLLLISFARSGNSPESIAAVELADSICRKCFHFIITCNAGGNLANFQTVHPKYVMVLPPETNDQSLAMTSSYTAMFLTGLLAANIYSGTEFKNQLNTAIYYGGKILSGHLPMLRQIAALPFQRVVFLGSGPLLGTAEESHLKVQELTDGRVMCTYDSFLGFGHGPKAVVDEATLVIYLFSNQPYVLKYELDLLDDMQKGKKPLFELKIAESASMHGSTNQLLTFSENGNQLHESFLPLCMILPAQLIGFFKSLLLRLMPDAPSTSGAISRVVEGVSIYPLEMQLKDDPDFQTQLT